MFVPNSQNLSIAWAELFLQLMAKGTQELSPVSISINDLGPDGLPNEIAEIRGPLDAALSKINGKKNPALSVNSVAGTIFPYALWNRNKNDKGEHLFERYRAIYKRIKARDSRNNRGTYFQRMIGYAPNREQQEPINQLGHIIATYNAGNHRRSALQASTFDPRVDHTNAPMMGFPCLQQVAFAPTEQGLTVTGFYPVQYIFERAYGNYLGLCWLGLFMANQLEMPFVGMNCFINVAQLGNGTKKELNVLASEIRAILKK
jgi:hypothetical protein